MGFFYEEAKTAPAPKRPTARGNIPIKSLNELGCSVCPRDKDDLDTPKMAPQGALSPLVYLLMPAPSMRDDRQGEWMQDQAGRAVLRQFPRSWDSKLRIGGMIQCATDTVEINQHERECCRGRVVKDIEESRPELVIGVGDGPLHWATGMSGGALRYRGSLIAAQFGNHRCWYYCVAYPNYAFKESKYPSEYQTALEHDIREALDAVENDDLPYLTHVGPGPYDTGLEILDEGQGADLVKLERSLLSLARAPRCGIDLETTGLRVFQKDPQILTAAVGTFEHTVCFPLDFPGGWSMAGRRQRAWELFVEWLLWSGVKVAHNLAMEMEWLAFFCGDKILRLTEWDDTMSMCHTMDERPGTKALDTQIRMRYGFPLKAQSRVDVSQKQWWLKYPLKDILRYNGLDAKWTAKLDSDLLPVVQQDPKTAAEHARKVRLAPTLVLTEAKGLPVDFDYAQELEVKFAAKVAKVADQIQRCPEVVAYTRKFGTFSPGNDDHVLQLMHKMLDRPETRKEEKGKIRITTDESALGSMPTNEVPSAPLILEFRGGSKQLSTYIKPITTRAIISADGLIHSKYNSMVAVTGRLAGEDPNPQNWPKRKHREVRGVVAAPLILAADYGQIEFRVVAMASEDRQMVKYCWTGYDCHGDWATRVVRRYPKIKDWIVSEFEVDWDEKGPKTLRQEMKNRWVFPMLFGSSAYSCARELHLPRDVADDMKDEFWDEFPGVLKWQRKLIDRYQKNLYVETLGGRKRRGPQTPNEVINHPIQGTAADIVTEAMNVLSERSQLEDDPDLHPNLNVHDDLTFIPQFLLDPARLEHVRSVVVEEMCKVRFDYINVPLVVEVSTGQRWSELKEIGVYRSHELFGHPNPYATERK